MRCSSSRFRLSLRVRVMGRTGDRLLFLWERCEGACVCFFVAEGTITRPAAGLSRREKRLGRGAGREECHPSAFVFFVPLWCIISAASLTIQGLIEVEDRQADTC